MFRTDAARRHAVRQARDAIPEGVACVRVGKDTGEHEDRSDTQGDVRVHEDQRRFEHPHGCRVLHARRGAHACDIRQVQYVVRLRRAVAPDRYPHRGTVHQRRKSKDSHAAIPRVLSVRRRYARLCRLRVQISRRVCDGPRRWIASVVHRVGLLVSVSVDRHQQQHLLHDVHGQPHSVSRNRGRWDNT